MRLFGALLILLIAASVCAAPESTVDAGVESKNIDALIDSLSLDSFKAREEATQKIWELGGMAMPALEKAELSKDPEQAHRARELIRKIGLDITPTTDPEIVNLVERYSKASSTEKLDLSTKLQQKRAWKQLLKLYAAETKQDVRLQLKPLITGAAVVAARESIIEGDSKLAKSYLELAPADAAGLLALAEFHRSQGTLETELKRSESLSDVRGSAWRLALHRAAGNLEKARDAAAAAGEIKISAVMAAMLGDPVPWLTLHREADPVYTDLALKRWRGQAVRVADFEPLVRSIKSDNEAEHSKGKKALFLLGEPELAEPHFLRHSPMEAYTYFESQERNSEALSALGIDAEKANYGDWIQKRIVAMTAQDKADPGDHGWDESNAEKELLILATFFEQRGMHDLADKYFTEPLLKIADGDPKKFEDWLSVLFGQSGSPSAPGLAAQIAKSWAGEDEARWGIVISCAFGDQVETSELETWLEEIEPKNTFAQRFQGMLALANMGRDPEHSRRRWIDSAWTAYQKAGEGERPAVLERIRSMARLNSDVATQLKIWDALDETGRKKVPWHSHLLNLSAAGRWEAAATIFLETNQRMVERNLASQPRWHASAAACFRRMGRNADATAQDAWVKKLALGHDSLEIANGYAFGDDHKRAAEWIARELRHCDPDSQQFYDVLKMHAEMLRASGQWLAAGALSEVVAQIAAGDDAGHRDSAPTFQLRIRLHADLGRAISLLSTDRAKAIAILDRCHRMFPGDGLLADDFYPAVRQAGLIQEHDQWFKISWQKLSAVIEQYPNSDNTMNTAAWLASRAQRNLDQGEDLLKRALKLNPDQPAFLDTMAETQFAKGNRAKALEWSTLAVNYAPEDPLLRRQHDRFANEKLPR